MVSVLFCYLRDQYVDEETLGKAIQRLSLSAKLLLIAFQIAHEGRGGMCGKMKGNNISLHCRPWSLHPPYANIKYRGIVQSYDPATYF